MWRTAINRRKHGRGGKRGRSLLPGLAAAGISAAALISVSAYLLIQGVVPVREAALLGKLCFTLASLLGCWLAARGSQRGKLVASAVTGVLLLTLTAACTLWGKGTGGLRLLTPCAITLGSVLLGAAAAARRRGGGYR